MTKGISISCSGLPRFLRLKVRLVPLHLVDRRGRGFSRFRCLLDVPADVPEEGFVSVRNMEAYLVDKLDFIHNYVNFIL